MKILLLPLYLAACLPCRSQAVRHSSTSFFTGFGACSYRFTDAFSFLSNQAALANLPQTVAGVYGEKKFLLTSLNQYTAAFAVPIRQGGFGLLVNWFGFTDYNESQIGLGYGKKLGKVDLGIQFNYTMMRMAGYGSNGAIGVEIGSIWHLTEKVHTGIQVINPLGGKFSNSREEKLASLYQLAIGYEASEKLFTSAEIIKEEEMPVNVRAALQYIVDKKFFARLGVATATASPFFGLGWKWKNCRADITAGYHAQLGLTPGLMLVFYGKEREEVQSRK